MTTLFVVIFVNVKLIDCFHIASVGLTEIQKKCEIVHSLDWDVTYRDIPFSYMSNIPVSEHLNKIHQALIYGTLPINKIQHITQHFVIPALFGETHWVNRHDALSILIEIGILFDIDFNPIYKTVKRTESSPFILNLVEKMSDREEQQIYKEGDVLLVQNAFSSVVKSIDFNVFIKFRAEKARKENAWLFHCLTGKEIDQIHTCRQLFLLAKKDSHLISYYIEALPEFLPENIIRKVIKPLLRRMESKYYQEKLHEIFQKNPLPKRTFPLISLLRLPGKRNTTTSL